MPSGVPSIRYMGLLFHAMQPMAADVRTAGPSRLRLVRDRRRAAINGRALVTACTVIYSGITGEREATMFHVYLFIHKICENRRGHVTHTDVNDFFKDLKLSDPMEVVQLYHKLPDNSYMFVWDEDGNEYHFSKGELLWSEKDSDIDLFPWYYV